MENNVTNDTNTHANLKREDFDTYAPKTNGISAQESGQERLQFCLPLNTATSQHLSLLREGSLRSVGAFKPGRIQSTMGELSRCHAAAS